MKIITIKCTFKGIYFKNERCVTLTLRNQENDLFTRVGRYPVCLARSSEWSSHASVSALKAGSPGPQGQQSLGLSEVCPSHQGLPGKSHCRGKVRSVARQAIPPGWATLSQQP